MEYTKDEIFQIVADMCGRENMHKRLEEKYEKIRYAKIGKSILNRDINAYFVGNGHKYVFVFAAHHALEDITVNIAYLLIDYLLFKIGGGRIKNVDCKLLLSKFCFVIVPCVNPDGIEMHRNGITESPLYERQTRMSGGDFSTWQANSRGVDLNHNYDFRFAEYKELEDKMGIFAGAALYSGEYPESEPETHAAANLVRTLSPLAVVSLHTQGEEFYAKPFSPKVDRIAAKISVHSGYKRIYAGGTASFGGLCDYTSSLGIPSFTIELGKGKNPLPNTAIFPIFDRICNAIALLPTFL